MLLMAMVAVARRSVGPVLVLIAGVIVSRLITITGAGSDIGPNGFFAQPAVTFFRHVVLGTDAHGMTTVLVIAVAAAVAAVVLARTRPALAFGVTGAIVAGYGLVGGVYSMNHFMKQAGYPDLSFEQQAWIDRAVGTGADVKFAPEGLDGVMSEITSFNRSAGSPRRPSAPR